MAEKWGKILLMVAGVATLLSGCIRTGAGAELSKLKQPSRSERAKEAVRIKTDLAMAYLMSRDYRSATATIEEAIKQGESYDMAWLARAQIYQHLKTYDKAEESFRRALALSPNSAEVNNNYGWFLCSVKEQPADSIAYFDKALSDPTYPAPEISYLNKGICTAKAGQYNMSDIYFEKALQQAPDFAPAIKERARARFLAGNLDAADREFRQYQSRVNVLSPDDLLLGWKISRATGEMQAASEYEQQLRTNFPYSDELKVISTGSAEE